MSLKFDQRAVKIQFLTEVAHFLVHLYNGSPLLPSERVTSDDEEHPQYVWYRFVRNRDYNMLERASPNPDSCLNDIITENYPLLQPAFGAVSRVGEHAFGVSEDKTYHHYFLLLPPKDELVLDDDSKGSADKFLRKLVKRAQAFLKQFADVPAASTTTTTTTTTTTSAPVVVAPIATAPVVAAAAPPPPVAVVPPPPPPSTATTTTSGAPVVLAAVKRDRNAMEQATQDQAELKALKNEESAIKRSRLAEEAKLKAEAALQRQRDEAERAAKAEADELARIAAEQERLEKERQARIAECPFPKRAHGAVGFVQEPFQTADGLVVNPWFLL
jgi:hypothetical protein